ncbi:MAG: hypothetical protein ROZ36_03020 [Thermincola sp.]|nr:hypothetical protein [Thermincola sp.]
MNVIAEGVETEDQLHFLRNHNCKQVQGYIYSRPVKVEEFRKMLSNGQIEACAQRNELHREFVNRRKYYRIHLTHPLLADMTIIKFMGKEISLGKTEVLVRNINLWKGKKAKKEEKARAKAAEAEKKPIRH